MIEQYTKLEKELHKDIQKLITNNKYEELTPNQCLIIFGRVYSTYVLEQLVKEGTSIMTARLKIGETK